MGHQSIKKGGVAITHFYMNHESKDYWTQLITIQFRDKAHLDGTTVEETMQEEAVKSRGVITKVHSKSEKEMIYERHFPTGERELVRLIMTKKGLHRVAYVKRGLLSPEDKAQWIDRLSKGEIRGRLKEAAVKQVKATKASKTSKAAATKK